MIVLIIPKSGKMPDVYPTADICYQAMDEKVEWKAGCQATAHDKCNDQQLLTMKGRCCCS